MNIVRITTLTAIAVVLIYGTLILSGSGGQECLQTEAETWSHRGVHTDLQENSSPAVELAIQSGFKGVELDAFFDPAHGLVVSHDKPYKKVDGELVVLEDLIPMLDGSGTMLWLDLKNLDLSNVADVVAALDSATTLYPDMRERIFVESAHGRALNRLAASYPAIYWVQYASGTPRGFLKRLSIYAILGLSDFDGITTDFRKIDTRFKKHFRSHCWYVFTVNDDALLEELMDIPEVKVVLTDLPFPK